jgi:hypothetical protein
MPDPLCLALAAAFTAGCMLIHANRARPDDVTMILVLVMVGLVNLSGATLASRAGPAIDPVLAAEFVGYRPRHD